MPSNPASPLLTINARAGETTTFMQDGTGFTAATTATVVDTNPKTTTVNGVVISNQFTFDSTTIPITYVSPTRILVTVICTPPDPNVPITWATTNIQVTTTTGTTAPVVYDPVPVFLRTHHQPSCGPAPTMSQFLDGSKDKQKSVIFVPVTGFGNIITATYTLTPTPTIGTWTVKARQLTTKAQVKLTFTFKKAEPRHPRDDNPPPPSILAVTLVAEDGTSVDAPPVPVTYVPDPDVTPDP